MERPASSAWQPAVRKLRAGDHLPFTGWRGHADERLAGDGCISGSCQGAALDIA
ncbi:MAG TPA: hypothetical protein VKS82_23160 [Streptosporangiaceae bacterium]|nr:hypothetical protein [Streptosporangiaceae bacterium]